MNVRAGASIELRRAVPRPRGVELLVNLLLGLDQDVTPLPPPAPGGFRAALDAVLVRALSNPPCVLSFSGGRDSSAVLALSCEAARRHGLPLPIPVIMRFPGDRRSDESSWQEMVLSHLRLRNAEILNLTHELDALGPTATSYLGRLGLTWPANFYMHAPILELARGGTLLTGVGGDELLGTSAPRRSWRAAAVGSLPRSLRAEILLRRRPPDVRPWRWLTAAGRALVRRALVHEEVSWPYRWDRSLDHWYAGRAFAALDGTLARLAQDRGVRNINPLVDRQVLTELRLAGGRRGFPSRTEAMRWLCGELLPPALLARTGKASFGGALWGPATRAFAKRWDGTGVDARWVDAEALRRELLAPEPDFRTIMLLHQAWLASDGQRAAGGSGVDDRSEEPPGHELDRVEAAPPGEAPGRERQQRQDRRR